MTFVAEIFVSPDPVKTIVAPETKPVPVNAVLLTLELSPYAGEITVRVGADVAVVPVAIKVTGVRDPLVAVSTFVPAVEPRVQPPAVAIPFVPVVADPPVTVPLPEVTVNMTLTPLTGLPFTSFTMTLGSVETAVPTIADWLSPAYFTSCV